jgi:hypothetical protein
MDVEPFPNANFELVQNINDKGVHNVEREPRETG